MGGGDDLYEPKLNWQAWGQQVRHITEQRFPLKAALQ